MPGPLARERGQGSVLDPDAHAEQEGVDHREEDRGDPRRVHQRQGRALHHNGDVPLLRLAEVLSTVPARLFGLPGGRLSPDAPADLILVDLDEPWIVREADIRSRSKNTCFEGARLQGKVLQTLVAGRTVFAA